MIFDIDKNPFSERLPELPQNGETNPKKAFGAIKPSTCYIPGSAIFALGKVMQLGAVLKKPKPYGPFNWREAPVDYATYYDAIMRHLDESKEGLEADPESREDPLAHIMACCAIVIDAKKRGTLIDNRPHSAKVIA